MGWCKKCGNCCFCGEDDCYKCFCGPWEESTLCRNWCPCFDCIFLFCCPCFCPLLWAGKVCDNDTGEFKWECEDDEGEFYLTKMIYCLAPFEDVPLRSTLCPCCIHCPCENCLREKEDKFYAEFAVVLNAADVGNFRAFVARNQNLVGDSKVINLRG